MDLTEFWTVFFITVVILAGAVGIVYFVRWIDDRTGETQRTEEYIWQKVEERRKQAARDEGILQWGQKIMTAQGADEVIAVGPPPDGAKEFYQRYEDVALTAYGVYMRANRRQLH